MAEGAVCHQKYRLVLQMLIFSLLASLFAQAQTRVTNCETLIDQPGSYVLENDLDNCSFGIVIRAENVRLNLNGHQITGRGILEGIGVERSHVTIVGPATIARFRMGVYGLGVNVLHVSNVMVAIGECGFCLAGERLFLNDNSVQAIQGVAFRLNCHMCTITGNNASFNTVGFVLTQSTSNALEGNMAEGDGQGFLVEGESTFNLIEGNTSKGNGADGIAMRGEGVTDNTLESNVSINNGGYGIATIRGAARNTIDHSTATGNTRFDLFQEGDTCVNNWEDNQFGTRNLNCIH